jgi:hypothetical protein
MGELSPLQEDEERFYVTAVLDKGNKQIKVATVEWKKEGFAEWWSGAREQLRGEVAEQGYGYRLAQIKPGSASCTNEPGPQRQLHPTGDAVTPRSGPGVK